MHNFSRRTPKPDRRYRHIDGATGKARWTLADILPEQGGEHQLISLLAEGGRGPSKLLTEWRNSAETIWLADAPVHPLQQALKDLERTYTNFFAKRADCPRFKRKGRGDSFRYPDPKQIKLNPANSPPVPAQARLAALSQSPGRAGDGEERHGIAERCNWFVSIQTGREVAQPIPMGGAVGIEMGIARFVTLSDGTSCAPLNSFKRHKAALRKAQQAMSCKTSQAFMVFLPVKSVGVVGDGRRYEYVWPCALWKPWIL